MQSYDTLRAAKPSRDRAHRYRRAPGAGRPRTPDKLTLEGINYKLRTGCAWKAIPKHYGSGSTLHRRYKELLASGYKFTEYPDSRRPSTPDRDPVALLRASISPERLKAAYDQKPEMLTFPMLRFPHETFQHASFQHATFPHETFPMHEPEDEDEDRIGEDWERWEDY